MNLQIYGTAMLTVQQQTRRGTGSVGCTLIAWQLLALAVSANQNNSEWRSGKYFRRDPTMLYSKHQHPAHLNVWISAGEADCRVDGDWNAWIGGFADHAIYVVQIKVWDAARGQHAECFQQLRGDGRESYQITVPCARITAGSLVSLDVLDNFQGPTFNEMLLATSTQRVIRSKLARSEADSDEDGDDERPPAESCGANVEEQMVAIPRHKLLLCFIPKVASAKLRELALRLMRSEHADGDYFADKPTLSDGEGFAEVRHLFDSMRPIFSDPVLVEAALQDDSYLRIAVVRNPFSRLLSAFKQRIEHEFDFEWNKQAHNLRGLPRPDFPTFLRRIAHARPFETDQHWRLQSCFCHLRSQGHRYDYILDSRNVSQVYDLVTAHSPRAAIVAPENPFRTWTLHTTNASVRGVEWTPDMVRHVRAHYAEDFARFGYSYNVHNQSCARCGPRAVRHHNLNASASGPGETNLKVALPSDLPVTTVTH